MALPSYLGRYQAGANRRLQAGQVLKFVKGQGYYAAPKPVAAAAPPAAPPAAPFDFNKAILGEGQYAADRGMDLAGGQAAQAQHDAAIKALKFQYNDPANPYSTVGELERQRKGLVGKMLADRAARGVQNSGGTVLNQTDIGHDWGKAMYDANNQVNGQIGSLDQNLADQLRTYGFNNANDLKSAVDRLVAGGVGPSGLPQTGAPAAAAVGAPAGLASNPAYVDPVVRQQQQLNSQGYQTAFLGTGDATMRKQSMLNPDGSVKPYTWEQHLADLVKAGKTKLIPGFSASGLPLPGQVAALARRKAGYA